MKETRSKSARRFAAAGLCAALLLMLSGCGSAQLKAGQKIIKDYLSGRGGRLTESYVELLRPDGTKDVASDFVKGTFRAGGADYEFAVNTLTGAVYTSEKLPELQSRCAAKMLAQLGLDADEAAAACRMELYTRPWQTPQPEWPWARSYLGHVLPTDVTDLDAYASACLADENVRIQLFVACRADALSAGRWTPADMTGWKYFEVRLFGFAADEPLPTPEELPGDLSSSFTGRRMTLQSDVITYHDGT